jgi:hypothetical protein
LNVPVVLIVLFLILVTPASAATVSTKSYCDRYSCSSENRFVAARGERNDVTLSESVPGFVDLHDAGAPVGGCTSIDTNTVRCASGTTFVDLGDGDDTFHGTFGIVDGGPGSDVLSGPAAFEDDDPAEPDHYIGPGTISYAARKDDLRIDLRAGTVAPDGDVLDGDIRDATGGFGDDVVIGTDAPNTLAGGYGSDRILGFGGDDVLMTGIDAGASIFYEPHDRDVVEGGAGDDTITVTSRHDAGNVHRCGAGRDAVIQVLRHDFVGGDCERLALGADDEHYAVHIHPRASVFVVDRVEGRKVAYAGDRVVARGRRNLRLNALGRRLLARRGRLKVTVEMHDRRATAGFRMELRR